MRMRPAQPAGAPGSDTRSTRKAWLCVTPGAFCEERARANVLNGPLRGMLEGVADDFFNDVVIDVSNEVFNGTLEGTLEGEGARTKTAWGAKNSTTA